MKQLMDEVETLGAGAPPTLNQYAPGGPIKQLVDYADLVVSAETPVLDQYALGGPLHQIDTWVDTAEGGGGIPEWVPEGAKIHIDLVRAFNNQDAAWTEADGIVAVDTLLGSDPNTEVGWGATAYNPDALAIDGYDMGLSGGPFALIGSALSLILAGSTFVLRYGMTNTGTPAGSPFVAISADGENAIEIDDAGSLTIEAYSYTGPYDRTSDAVINAGVEGALNALAMTLTASRAEFAVNGSSVYEDTLNPDEFIQTGDSPIVVALVDTRQNTAVQSLTIYDPLPDTTGLSALSEVS